MFSPYLRFGNTDATVYSGITRKGREIYLKEDYEDDSPDHSRRRSDLDRQKAGLRALYTTHQRIEEFSRMLPNVKFAITAEGRMDMDERTFQGIWYTALIHDLQPYPEKVDPRIQKFAEDWDRLQRSLR